jgi:lysophospholipase L1-like esterase
VAYPERLDGRMRISLDDDATCAGALALPDPDPLAFNNVLTEQLWALDGDTDLVTLTIGGNDTGWFSVVAACLGGTDLQCGGAITVAEGRIQTLLPGVLAGAYSAVDTAAPDAHVVVTGYPRLFSPEYGAYLGASVEEQQRMNAAADLLNTVIATTAEQFGFQYVDVAGKFDGHGVNAPDAWITGVSHPVPLHPTADGQNAYAAAVTAAINPRDLR